jgi:hypothetical protein
MSDHPITSKLFAQSPGAAQDANARWVNVEFSGGFVSGQVRHRVSSKGKTVAKMLRRPRAGVNSDSVVNSLSGFVVAVIKIEVVGDKPSVKEVAACLLASAEHVDDRGRLAVQIQRAVNGADAETSHGITEEPHGVAVKEVAVVAAVVFGFDVSRSDGCSFHCNVFRGLRILSRQVRVNNFPNDARGRFDLEFRCIKRTRSAFSSCRGCQLASAIVAGHVIVLAEVFFLFVSVDQGLNFGSKRVIVHVGEQFDAGFANRVNIPLSSGRQLVNEFRNVGVYRFSLCV